MFTVRVKPMQNVIIKNEKNPWLEILLHVKKILFSDICKIRFGRFGKLCLNQHAKSCEIREYDD